MGRVAGRGNMELSARVAGGAVIANLAFALGLTILVWACIINAAKRRA